MYHIAICDDTDSDLKRIRYYVEKSPKFTDSMQVSMFSSGIELLDEAERYHMDMVILDMQMPGINGYETATELRKFNSKTILAFCSADCVPKPDYFRVHPYRYLMKNESEEKCISVMTELILEMIRIGSQKNIKITADGKAMSIKADEIMYIEKVKYGSEIILSPASVLYERGTRMHAREKLDELYKELFDEGFARPHASYAVNLKFVKAVDRMEIILENGERLSVTRSMREEFHHKFSKYFMKKYQREKS